jgi:AcrR family transcriptional regulator
MPKIEVDTRTEILKVALQLFLKKGYKEVSYSDLIAKTGLSKGALYHHFKSKEDLLIATFEFLLESSKQQGAQEAKVNVKDKESFKKLFIESKIAQIDGIKKLFGTKSIKFNKLLFFFEAINENEKLKKDIMDLMKQEMGFLEKCFVSLKKHKGLPKEKDPALLAESLYWMLQGAEMMMFFVKNNDSEKDFIKIYDKTISDFFKII